jgi:hypothetical protein
MTIFLPNQPDGVDAEWRILPEFGRPWPDASHRERYAVVKCL